MKRIEVKVCMCTHCIMNGAMDIVESVESLQKLKTQLRFGASVKVNAKESLCEGEKKGIVSPLVYINEERVEKATSEMVMSKVIALSAKE